MNTWIILLRSINVGGHNILTIADLRAALTSHGLQDVATYIQSGNIVLTSATSDVKKIASETAQLIEQAFGMELDVRALSANTFQRIIEANPFPEAASDPKTLHLSFLAQPPDAFKLTTLEGLAGNGERLVLHDRGFEAPIKQSTGSSVLEVKPSNIKSTDVLHKARNPVVYVRRQ